MGTAGIAMPNSKRLNKCFADLHQALVGTLPGSGDEPAWRARDGDVYRQAKVSTRQRLGTAVGDGKIHREAMRIVAEHAICGELRAGRLALWTMFDNVPAEMDHHWSHLIDRHTLTAGCIHPSKNPPSSLEDRPLWVLLSDWRAFKQRFMSSREGVEWSEPMPLLDHSNDSVRPFSDDERRQWMTQQSRKSADEAYKDYRNHPRHVKTKQAVFRQEWKRVHGTTRGRPRKLSWDKNRDFDFRARLFLT